MAVRLNPKQDERTRSAIQTSAIVARLQEFVLAKLQKRSGKPTKDGKRDPVIMTDTQVRAALGLLKKTLPDLAIVTLQGDEGRPLNHSLTINFVKPTIAQEAENALLRSPVVTIESDAIEQQDMQEAAE
jgi:hypothetical protein